MDRNALDDALLLGAETLETAATLGLSAATLLSVSRRLMDARAALAAAPDQAAGAREAFNEAAWRWWALDDQKAPSPHDEDAWGDYMGRVARAEADMDEAGRALLAAEREVCPQTCPVQLEPGECKGEDHGAAQKHGGCDE